MTEGNHAVLEFHKAKKNPLKLLIGIPTRGELKADCALSLAFLIHVITANPIVKVDGEPRFLMWSIKKVTTSKLPTSRQILVDTCIDSGCDWLLFLDDDMVFDPEFLLEWLQENRPVIAMNCPTRSIPCYPTARQFDPKFPFKGALVYSDVANTRYERVWRVGTGIMLLRVDALKALPRPAFLLRWEEGNDHDVGEDWVLCEHLEATGIPIFVDHQFSLGVEHIGDMAFKHEMVAGTRMQLAKQAGKSDIIIPGIEVHKELPVDDPR